MAGITIEQHQRALQRQTMHMTQQQLAALRLLALGAAELRAEILRQVAENPALELVFDPEFDRDVRPVPPQGRL